MLSGRALRLSCTTSLRAADCAVRLFPVVRRTFVRPSFVTMAPRPIPLPRHVCDALGLDESEEAFREGSATIVLPKQEAAFLNPVQEFNRDLSVLALRAWSNIRNAEKRKRFEASANKRKAKMRKREAKEASMGNGKRAKVEKETHALSSAKAEEVEKETEERDGLEAETKEADVDTFREYKFSLLEALSATGLRSIRYAREVPLLRNVVANDLSTTAVEAMKRNVALNFPAGRPIKAWQPASESESAAKSQAQLDEDTIAGIENGIETAASGLASSQQQNGKQTPPIDTASAIHPACKVTINEADAITLMYAHREEKKRFDVVDLDPYGSASIFLDGAVQCVADAGLLAITCTDTAVLAGTSHPEKCYSAYGGVTTKTEYSHEFALRLLLHAIATSAARYGRYIEPMLSLSIDFYIRVFVRVHTRPVEVKRLASTMGAVFTCSSCQLFSTLPFGRHQQTETAKGQTLEKFQAGAGPSVGPYCDECGSRFHTAGPMWLGPLHDRSFCHDMLAIVDCEPTRFATRARIQGMVGTAAEELNGADALFFFTPSRVSSFFRCSSPPMLQVVSALLHAGHQVSRSHCQPGSLKTTATRADVYDLWRAFVKRTPVKMESISESSPAMKLLSRPLRDNAVPWNLDDEHPEAKSIIQGSSSSRGTRYQLNPLANWGPGTAARTSRAK